jgi:hypothetical protein
VRSARPDVTCAAFRLIASTSWSSNCPHWVPQGMVRYRHHSGPLGPSLAITCTPQEEDTIPQSRQNRRLPVQAYPQVSCEIDSQRPTIHRPHRRPLTTGWTGLLLTKGQATPRNRPKASISAAAGSLRPETLSSSALLGSMTRLSEHPMNNAAYWDQRSGKSPRRPSTGIHQQKEATAGARSVEPHSRPPGTWTHQLNASTCISCDQRSTFRRPKNA